MIVDLDLVYSIPLGEGLPLICKCLLDRNDVSMSRRMSGKIRQRSLRG